MNLSRGLFRTWITATAVWITYWVWDLNLTCAALGIASPPWCAGYGKDPFTMDGRHWASTAALVVGLPLAALMAAFAAASIIRGFATHRPN